MIKTVKVYDEEEEFDKKLNDLLNEGFEILKLEIVQVPHLTGIYYIAIMIDKRTISLTGKVQNN
jgi:hypothetical protein